MSAGWDWLLPNTKVRYSPRSPRRGLDRPRPRRAQHLRKPSRGRPAQTCRGPPRLAQTRPGPGFQYSTSWPIGPGLPGRAETRPRFQGPPPPPPAQGNRTPLKIPQVPDAPPLPKPAQTRRRFPRPASYSTMPRSGSPSQTRPDPPGPAQIPTTAHPLRPADTCARLHSRA